MKPKEISKEEYVKMFCRDRRIRERKVVYVSEETHGKLRRVANIFRGEYQTVASLADAIIAHHIGTYRQLLNRLEQEQRKATMEWLSQYKSTAGEAED